jgi:tRNA(Ile)-lysidine synthase
MKAPLQSPEKGLRMLERVAETLQRYHTQLAGSRLAVAVSGGADSVCLLHVLHRLQERFGYTIFVAHLNHQLRGTESDADESFVQELAGSLRLEAVVERTDVRSLDPNLEQAGRKARLAFFRGLRGRGLADWVATGHTATDQAETVLMRMLRGSWTTGLAGILPLTSDGRIRPLLHCHRHEVHGFLQNEAIGWREDSSNGDLAFLRNRLRAAVVPQLREISPEFEARLARMARLAQEDEAYWRDQVRATGLLENPEMPVEKLRELPQALARRVVREAIRQSRGDLLGINERHLEAVLLLAIQVEGSGSVILPGIVATRSQLWLRVEGAAAPRAGSESQTGFPTSIWRNPSELGESVQAGDVSLELLEIPSSCEVHPNEKGYTGEGFRGAEALVDADRVRFPLVLREWRPGDRVFLKGKERKLKDLFQRARVPRWERQGWPVLVSGDWEKGDLPVGTPGMKEGRIVWTKRFGVAETFAADARSRRVLRVRARQRTTLEGA